MATARLVRDAYDTRLAPLDLSLTQALVLEYLSDFGPVTQTRIADHLHQGRAATVRRSIGCTTAVSWSGGRTRTIAGCGS